ncbi:hypothetical protein F1559_004430 [Cyanidiococcus yangmingshanensis]|uniref:Cytochrome b5 heme-binding domain-containing protein n=1 Tax=Cyanidiococcus yangmingshanensis TaxID=2690220 RepID=A0A7J7IN75_9RHOD|nr:hypothetical protein F1559_004430 [Cyanidiococcus yangmingshanensis]
MSIAVLLRGLVALTLLWFVFQRVLRSRVQSQRTNRLAGGKRPVASALVEQPSTQALRRSTAATQKYFTAAEVSQHYTRDSLWLIIDGRVYDVTSYIDHHPGGDAIFRNAGRDSSAGFHGDQHPEKVNEILPDFYIGELANQTGT